MAIVMMCGDYRLYDVLPENVVAVRDYAGAQQGLSHSSRCVHYADGRTDRSALELTAECVTSWGDATGNYDAWKPCKVCDPLFMRTTHVGLVLSTGERNGYDDSDFYALVWNPEKGCPEQITYATTRGWTYPNNATADATPETIAAYTVWYQAAQDAKQAAYKAAQEAAAAKRATMEACLRSIRALHGSTHTVGKGKTKFTGKLFWSGISKSGDSVRCGLKAEDGSVKWIAAKSILATV